MTDSPFLERLAIIMGQTTYREPVGSYGVSVHHIPSGNCLVLTLNGARMGDDDIGPELAISRVVGREDRKEAVLTWLMKALKRFNPILVAKCRKNLPMACEIAYLSFISETEIPENADITPDERVLLDTGYYLLESALWETVGRAERNENRV